MDEIRTRQPGPDIGAGPDPDPAPPPGERPGAGRRRTDPGGSRLARRRRTLVGVGGGAALMAVGGLIGATFVKSPAQLAADTAPPAETVTTAKVVDQDLTASVAMRGVVYPSTQYDVSASGAAAQLYISKLDVTVGASVGNGQELAEIDGAPMFVLTGAVPAWRDLAPGESGPDVAELQKALAALGYGDHGDTKGYYGSGTGEAVAAFYKHLGYTAPTSGAAGPEVPQGDVLFLPSLPASVIAVDGAVGQQAGSPFLTLAAGGALTLTGELPPAYASQIRTGLQVKISDEATGISATGTVAGVGAPTETVPTGTTVQVGGSGATGSGGSSNTSGSNGSSGGSGATLFVPVTVTPTTPLPAALNGENVLVTVLTGQTEGPVLTVPVAAIVTTASGQSSVTVVGRGGAQTQVRVTPGMTENGTVQVTPLTPGALVAGDNVVVSG